MNTSNFSIQSALRLFVIVLILLTSSCAESDMQSSDCNPIGAWTQILQYEHSSGEFIQDGWIDPTIDSMPIAVFTDEPHFSAIKQIIADGDLSKFMFGPIILEFEEDGDIFQFDGIGFDNYEMTDNCTVAEIDVSEGGITARIRHGIQILDQDLAIIDFRSTGLTFLCLRQ